MFGMLLSFYNYFVMEENIDVQDSATGQNQDSLLSSKMQKIDIQPIKALISLVMAKEKFILAPLQTLDLKLVRKSCEKVSQTQQFKRKWFKAFSTQSRKITCNKNNKIDQKITYKFLKYCLNDSKGNRTIFEQKVFSIDEISGSGILIVSDGRIMQGTWIDGLPQGKLKIEYPNEIIYYGEVYDYRQHGYGYLYYPDNRKYEGHFCYGQFHGSGIYYDQHNQVKKKGEWKHGKYIGQ